eukprot:CAMPEP_0185830036 /NCGR_PEP_ID=MMETSP1353-20130828/591_1 /TAXON_ID=1077150 /ORGANISM="Erythrolobus australicus, Strain CCMP3124" /LENGTH=855 /DNA_ID=CAMNT_0028527891 /DNA_START=53 /DNA_END=2620 /DNA_ORIENTATION=-
MLKGVVYPQAAPRGRRMAANNAQLQMQQQLWNLPHKANAEEVDEKSGSVSREEAMTDSEGRIQALSLFEQLTKIQGQLPHGRVELGLAAFGHLVGRSLASGDDSRPDLAPTSAVFEKVGIVGEAKEDHVSVQVEYEIVVLRDGWSQVELLSTALAVERIEITPADTTARVEPAEVGREEASADSAQGAESAAVVNDEAQRENEDDAAKELPATAYIGIRGKFYCLFSCGSSRWRLKIHALGRYGNSQKRSFAMRIPESLCSELHFTVPSPGALIKVDPALEQRQRTLPVALSEAQREAAREEVVARLPPTSELSLSWMEPAVGGEQAALGEEKERLAVAVTAEQCVLASIGEGLISYRMDWALDILHGARFLFEIEIPPSLVVRNVLGSGIKKWEISSAHRLSRTSSSVAAASEPAAAAVVTASGDVVSAEGGVSDGEKKVSVNVPSTQQHQRERRVLRIWHQLGAEGAYSLSIVAEEPLTSEPGAAGGAVESGGDAVPVSSGLARLSACRMVDVERQRGFVAVEARTNVEVNEVEALQLTKIDANELPYELQTLAQSALLCSYKFLAPNWAAQFRIKRHADVEVLVAVIDEAWLTATLVAEGKMQVKVELKVRNTTRQYLRMKMPEHARIWSTEVNGALVKPAFDAADGALMVALEKSTGESQGKEYFWTDLVYIVELDALSGRGKLDIALPQWDLPVNQLFVELFLPKTFRYGEFTGDLKETKSGFSRGKYREEPAAFGGGGRMRRGAPGGGPPPPSNALMMAQAAAPVQELDEIEEERRESSIASRPKAKPMKKAAVYRSAGVKPVRVEAIREGTCFRFERMLVDNDSLRLSVRYAEISDSFWGKRRLNWFS